MANIEINPAGENPQGASDRNLPTSCITVWGGSASNHENILIKPNITSAVAAYDTKMSTSFDDYGEFVYVSGVTDTGVIDMDGGTF